MIEVFFYATVFTFLFVSIFWILTFFSKKDEKIVQTIKKFPSLSIAIPVFNDGHLLEKCVESLVSQKYPRLKILIMNDGSTDNTEKVAKKLVKKYKNIEYHFHENCGKAATINKALLFVETELFGFIDADTYLSENALKNLVSKIRGKKVSVIASVRPFETNTLLDLIQKIEYMLTAFTRKLMSFLDSLYYTPAFAIYKTDVVKELGGFDEDNITEDLEMGLKLNYNGYDIETSLDDYAFTELPRTFRAFFKQRIRWYRGYIHNSIKYKDMLLNRNFSHLGLFVLPIQFLVLGLSTIMIMYGIFDFFTNSLDFLGFISVVNFDIPYIISKGTITITGQTLFFLLILASFFAMLKLSQRGIGEEVRKFELIVYLIAYPFINIFLWTCAFIMEILRVDKKW